MKCDQCAAAMINGVFCHEAGCPNTRKRWDRVAESWVQVVECPECGAELDPDGRGDYVCTDCNETPIEEDYRARWWR